jgi:hypothetical protein
MVNVLRWSGWARRRENDGYTRNRGRSGLDAFVAMSSGATRGNRARGRKHLPSNSQRNAKSRVTRAFVGTPLGPKINYFCGRMPKLFQFYLTSRLALQVSFGVPLGILLYKYDGKFWGRILESRLDRCDILPAHRSTRHLLATFCSEWCDGATFDCGSRSRP